MTIPAIEQQLLGSKVDPAAAETFARTVLRLRTKRGDRRRSAGIMTMIAGVLIGLVAIANDVEMSLIILAVIVGVGYVVLRGGTAMVNECRTWNADARRVCCPQCDSVVMLNRLEATQRRFVCPECSAFAAVTDEMLATEPLHIRSAIEADEAPALDPGAGSFDEDDDDDDGIAIPGTVPFPTGRDLAFGSAASARATDDGTIPVRCPHCNASVDLDEQEWLSGRFICPKCTLPATFDNG